MVLIGLSITLRRSASRQELLTTLLGVTVGATAIDYLSWRVVATNWVGWEIAVPLLAAEMFGAVHTLGLQYTVWPWPQPRIIAKEDPIRLPIFILIPTVNEGPSVLAPTIQGALEARRSYLDAFPHGQVTIAVCNDGRVAGVAAWRDVEDLARSLGVVCITRTVGGGNKAGNLEHARQQLHATGDALIVIFDADQIAKPDFLLTTVPPLADPTVGWVQTGQYNRNVDQPVARWANDQQALFYRVLCPGKAAHNAAFICGTNVVVRAAALDQIGGLPQDSVTEDFAASIQLHSRWRSIFLTDVLAVGLGPMDLPAYLKQQRRWAIGTIGVLRTHWREIFLPRRGGLRMDQRIQYGLACTHYLHGLRDVIYVVAPLVFLITGVPVIRGATLGLFLWHFLPYWIASQGAFWLAGRRQTGLRGIIIGFGSFPSLLKALLTVLLGHRAGFMVTSKKRSGGRAWTHLIVYVVVLVCCFGGIWLALRGRHARPGAVAISAMWVMYDIALLAGFLWLGISDLRFKDPSERRHGRIHQLAVSGRTLMGLRVRIPALTGVAARISRSRGKTRQPMGRRTIAAVSGYVLIGGFLMTSSSAASINPVRFAVSQASGQSTYLGLSLPHELLKTRPYRLESQVCLPFAIIGRTQDIQDSFDFGWAAQLSIQNQRPWITLQFGNFGRHHTAPLDASLPAIANGLQDANIERWASDIHTYGKPIFLTILLHVDRNWSVSSAVANGGIPQDAPRVWEHVQSIFKAAGDTNVAWVWAPADPAHDEPYAPPRSTIDVVLQSMIRYPSTRWPDPGAVIRAVTARYPTKPLFVEVSAKGGPAQKATWLKLVGAAVQTHPNVYALMYHEGAPDLHATRAADLQWSVESDALSLQSMRAWRSLVRGGAQPCRSSRVASPQTPAGPTDALAPIGASHEQAVSRPEHTGRLVP
jgi:cellulose synthase/poly-beta-1,6-N-acetylglucosamine synthase-like glycosyltransferase